MAITHVTIRCPNCKKVLERSSYHGAGRGPRFICCPIQVCPSCKQRYYDERCTEAATRPMKWYIKREPVPLIKKPLEFFFYVPVFLTIGMYLWLMSTGRENSDLIFMCMALFLVSLVSSILLAIYNATHTDFYVDAEFEREYRASEKRLQDPEYVAFLRKMGAKLPKKYQ